MPLPMKEYLSISDRLRLEELLVKKYKMFSAICTDPQLKIKCDEVAAEHQNHYNSLFKLIN